MDVVRKAWKLKFPGEGGDKGGKEGHILLRSTCLRKSLAEKGGGGQGRTIEAGRSLARGEGVRSSRGPV